MFWSQKVFRGDHFLLGIPDHKGGLGNPSAPIDFNGKTATNIRSKYDMHGAEFHCNNRHDGPTSIRSIQATYRVASIRGPYTGYVAQAV